MLYESCGRCSSVLERQLVSQSAFLDEQRPKPSKPSWSDLDPSRPAASEFSKMSGVHGWVRLDLLAPENLTKTGFQDQISRKSRKQRRLNSTEVAKMKKNP